MPKVKSKVQHRFLQMCAHSPQHAQGKCPAPAIAKEILGHQSPRGLPERKGKKR
jgi:hypothetical protein